MGCAQSPARNTQTWGLLLTGHPWGMPRSPGRFSQWLHWLKPPLIYLARVLFNWFSSLFMTTATAQRQEQQHRAGAAAGAGMPLACWQVELDPAWCLLLSVPG